MRKFIKGIKKELGCITWPGRKETINKTAVIMVVSVIFAGLISFLDTGCRYLISLFV